MIFRPIDYADTDLCLAISGWEFAHVGLVNCDTPEDTGAENTGAFFVHNDLADRLRVPPVKLPTGEMSHALCISAAPKNFKYEHHNGKIVDAIKNNKGGDQAIFVDCDEDDGLQFFQIGAKALSPKLS